MYKHVMWDFDGTLFDSYPIMGKIFQESLLNIGIDEPLDEILKHMKVSMTEAFNHYEKTYQINDEFKENYHAKRTKQEIEMAEPFQGALEICKYIHESGGKNYLYTHRGQSSIVMLKKFGMYDYFTDFITSEHGFERKPKPDAIQFLLDKHGINKEEAIMIGDRDLDILAAKNAGISACFFSENGDTSSHADYNITDFEQLRSLK
ncbi:HAD-IA family hydrolase [Falsibacillus pallidus]|uniref:HAD-IA family hydrolase n=1 Tax=Falsibacillus pallidus TaxID=493781 RepID=UPI003D96FC82